MILLQVVRFLAGAALPFNLLTTRPFSTNTNSGALHNKLMGHCLISINAMPLQLSFCLQRYSTTADRGFLGDHLDIRQARNCWTVMTSDKLNFKPVYFAAGKQIFFNTILVYALKMRLGGHSPL